MSIVKCECSPIKLIKLRFSKRSICGKWICSLLLLLWDLVVRQTSWHTNNAWRRIALSQFDYKSNNDLPFYFSQQMTIQIPVIALLFLCTRELSHIILREIELLCDWLPSSHLLKVSSNLAFHSCDNLVSFSFVLNKQQTIPTTNVIQ